MPRPPAPSSRSAPPRSRTAPSIFVAGGQRFAIRPAELGVEPDWKAAVDAAQRQGDGFGPIRGFRRLDVQVFGADVTPPTRPERRARVQARAARRQGEPRRRATLRSSAAGANIVVVPARAGLVLDRHAAERTLVRSLASIDRTSAHVELPLRVQQPRVRAAALAAPHARRASRCRRRCGSSSARRAGCVQPRRIAQLLELPAGGRTSLQIGGPAADAWVAGLGQRVEKPAQDATFAVHGGRVSVVPGEAGHPPRRRRHRRRPAAGGAEAAARRCGSRGCRVQESQAKLSTDAARAMHITRARSRTTRRIYGGIANRIHNVQLVAHLVDGKLIAPGATFSFNQTTGERNAAKGFLEAPVIVNGELTTGLGGGVCQVSTTVFNAAFEAGLKITERTNHALYISHYPQGRDATVDYPTVDLKFVNDTGNWLLLRTFVSSSSLTVGLYGTPVAPQGRRARRAARLARRAAGEEDDRPVAQAGREGRRRPGRRRRCRRASRATSTRRTASSSTTTRGTRRTAPSRSSCASGPSEEEAEEARTTTTTDYDDDDRRRRRLSRRNSVLEPLRHARRLRA